MQNFSVSAAINIHRFATLLRLYVLPKAHKQNWIIVHICMFLFMHISYETSANVWDARLDYCIMCMWPLDGHIRVIHTSFIGILIQQKCVLMGWGIAWRFDCLTESQPTLLQLIWFAFTLSLDRIPPLPQLIIVLVITPVGFKLHFHLFASEFCT